MGTLENSRRVSGSHLQHAKTTRLTDTSSPEYHMVPKTAPQTGKKESRVPKSKLLSGVDNDVRPFSTGPLKRHVPSETEPLRVKGGFELTLNFERLFSSSPFFPFPF